MDDLTMENLDFGITTIILKFWPALTMTMTPERWPNSQKIMVTSPPPPPKFKPLDILARIACDIFHLAENEMMAQDIALISR